MRDLKTTRLGEGLNISRGLSGPAMTKTLVCLRDFKAVMDQYGVKKFRIVATSAVREASNNKEFVAQIKQETGFAVDIITAEEEAELSYIGVTRSLQLAAAPLVVDLGGGSTEFMFYEGNQRYWASLPLGAVRATEAGISAVDILERLKPVMKEKDRFRDKPLVLVGGTATTAVAVKLALDVYQPERVHGEVLSRTELADLYNMVESMPLSLLRRLPGLQPERADIIGRGLLIVLLIVDCLGKNELIVSESDLLQGIIWGMAENDRER
jgi:exopolyphosphatase/guanosine-5'-triphosphate,3'-diphosphate pyrophosphatase